jgi:hypothetical protein
VLTVRAGYVQRQSVLAYLILGMAGCAILLWTAWAIMLGQRRSRNIHGYWPLVVMSIAVSSAVLAWTNARPWRLLEVGATEAQHVKTGKQRGTQVWQAAGGEKQRMKEDSAGEEETSLEKQKDAVLAQVCIAGSLSFWLSVGLLVAWSIKEPRDEPGVQPTNENQ